MTSRESRLRLTRVITAAVIATLVIGSLWPASQPATAQENDPPEPTPPEVVALEALGAHVAVDSDGDTRFVSFDAPDRFIPRPGALPESANPEAVARGFLQEYGTVFGLQDEARELRLVKEQDSDKGGAFTRFQQLFEGIPVLGGELIVSLDAGRNIRSASGEISDVKSLSTSPQIGTDTARQAALDVTAKAHGVELVSLTASDPELWIYDPSLVSAVTGPAALVWRVEVTSLDLAPIRELVLVDALRGSVALHFNQVSGVVAGIRPVDLMSTTVAGPPEGAGAVLGSPDLATYTANNGASLPGTFLCDESAVTCTSGGGSNPDANAAHQYARDTYNFYATRFGRDSINGAGLQVVSTVDYGVNYANAFWDGSQMVYGDGYALADDVVGHELTHGVTQYESNLLYYYQSGAINEALSDIFGEFVDLTNGAGDDSPGVRWLLGEDLPIDAIRDMEDPGAYAQPDKMTSPNYYFGAGDNGGVHYNSGIANKAAYLMVDGGTFNSRTVTALGIDKTAAIWYYAQVNLLTSGSDYFDLYNALYQACNNLVGGSTGITVFDCIEVRDASDAVEMNVQPSAGFNTDAPICSGGQTPNNIFFDGFESGIGSWTTGTLSGVNRWQWDSPSSPHGTASAHTGAHSLYADDSTPSGTSDSYAAMTNGVVLPANAYLHFAHNYGFEFSSSTYWDGGVLEYSTSGLGGPWIDANALFDSAASPNNGYDATLDANNPLAIPTNAVAKTIDFNPKTVTWVRFQVSGGSGSNVGLSEIQAISSGANIASSATVTVSSQLSAVYSGAKAVDGVIGQNGSGEWASQGEVNPWIQLTWGSPQTLNIVSLYDRVSLFEDANGGVLTFSDGSSISIGRGFADDSHGYISSRYSLASLAGQTVRFRFRMGTDSTVADAGWWIDDVRIYTCTTDPNPPTFADVPFDHWAHDYIEAIWDAGYTRGCNATPLMYCPDQTMNRAESAVFVVRGIHGESYSPVEPTVQRFNDVPLLQWYTKWTEQLAVDGYTTGCNANPPLYCPFSAHTRAEGSVFYLRMLNGSSYSPPEPSVQIFSDVPLGQWYTKWTHAAYEADLLEPCETTPELKFCPNGPLTRALAAYMMVKAKDLPLP